MASTADDFLSHHPCHCAKIQIAPRTKRLEPSGVRQDVVFAHGGWKLLLVPSGRSYSEIRGVPLCSACRAR
jgi:hypothetical protein